MTGTKLVDPRSGALVWGTSAQLLRPRDLGYALVLPLPTAGASDDDGVPHPQALYDPVEPILEIKLAGFTKPIYRPLLERLRREGYRLGRLGEPGPQEDLFFFDYDWRRSTVDSARQLGRELDALGTHRGGDLEVDLVCQSNAAKICRYLVKYGTLLLDEAESGRERPRASFRIRKLVLVGASNRGALRTLLLLDRGRRYLPLVGRKMSPEMLFSLRALFDDLPADRNDLFVDSEGNALGIDLFRAQSWVDYGWSVFRPRIDRRLEKTDRQDLFGSRDERLLYLGRQLLRSRRFQALLLRDAPAFPRVAYYRLENESQLTVERAVVNRSARRWRTFFFPDRRVASDSKLRRLTAAPGDEHATLESQRHLSPQEEAALAGTAMIEGGHFEMIIEPQGLDALVSFLKE